MSRWSLAEAVTDVSETAFYAAGRVFRLVFRGMPRRRGRHKSKQDTEVDELRVQIDQLRRGFEELAGDGTLRGLVDQARFLYQTGEDSRQTIQLFIRLVEFLVNDAEVRFGPQPGQGQAKAHEVKGILLHLFLDAGQPVLLPMLPPFAAPIVIEAVVTISIDAVAILFKKDRLYAVPGSAPESGPWWLRLLFAIQRMLGPLTSLFESLPGASSFGSTPCCPVRAELSSGRKASFLPDIVRVADSVTRVARWALDNREQLGKLVLLVGVGVKQAETLLNKTGKEKKRYVKEWILALLLDTGFLTSRDTLMYSLTNLFLDVSIEAVFDIYKRHGLLALGGGDPPDRQLHIKVTE